MSDEIEMTKFKKKCADSSSSDSKNLRADTNLHVSYHAAMPSSANLVRREIIQAARTLVVKIGTNVLSQDDDTLDDSRFEALAAQVHAVRQSGRQVVLVSSGAIGAGIGLLGLKTRPVDLPHLQAAAAVGQAHLIDRYDDALKRYGYHAAQLLLTANDFRGRARYLNLRNTLRTLFEYNVIRSEERR